MAKFLIVIELMLLVYCLIDCIQADTAAVRTLPKPVWVVLIILLPLFGGVGWLLAGRPESGATTPVRQGSWPRTPSGTPTYGASAAPKGPDDDPEFLRGLRHQDQEREFKQWEDDLRERERRRRDGDQPPDHPTDASS